MVSRSKGRMRGSIRRQGEDTWQVRVYNRGAKRYEYFTVKGRIEEARDARSRRLSEIAGGDRPPPRNASRVTVRELADEWLDRKRATREPNFAHTTGLAGDHEAAVERYKHAREVFERVGRPQDVAACDKGIKDELRCAMGLEREEA